MLAEQGVCHEAVRSQLAVLTGDKCSCSTLTDFTVMWTVTIKSGSVMQHYLNWTCQWLTRSDVTSPGTRWIVASPCQLGTSREIGCEEHLHSWPIFCRMECKTLTQSVYLPVCQQIWRRWCRCCLMEKLVSGCRPLGGKYKDLIWIAPSSILLSCYRKLTEQNSIKVFMLFLYS